MSPENSEKLYSAFPRLFRGRDKSAEESSMHRGFECEDGWFRLIWELSLGIEDLARKEGLPPDHEDWPEAVQVKQKMGGLRFHLRHCSEAMMELKTAAENASTGICELCGEPGSVQSSNQRRIQTLCPNHAHAAKSKDDGASKMPVWKLFRE